MTIISFIKEKLNEYNKIMIDDDIEKKLQYVIKNLIKEGIYANYDPISAKENRIILYSSRYNKNFELISECNGIIFDYITWEVLYIPPLLPNAKFDMRIINKYFNEYNVYPLKDGTVVGLYYYNDKWRISTIRGLDVSNVSWCGITYMNALTAAMETTNYSWDSFNKEKNYTLGFTCPTMHYTQKYDIWVIKSDDPNINQQSSMYFEKFGEIQSVIKNGNEFGFILRSKNSIKTGVNSTILLESKHMSNIRTLVYDKKLHESAEAIGVTPKTFAFCKCLLNEYLQQKYLQLYDEKEKQDKALEKINNLPNLIKNNDPSAKWFRDHLNVIKSIDDMSSGEILDFILIEQNISVLIKYLDLD